MVRPWSSAIRSHRGVLLTRDNARGLAQRIDKLVGHQVLVGIPAEHTLREMAEHKGPITNAALGYIQEFGSPARNIPARPWLIPGVRESDDKVRKRFEIAAKRALDGDTQAVEVQLGRAGMDAVSTVRERMTRGIPPPLSERTLQARARRKRGSGVRIRKGATAELQARAAGNLPSVEFAKPLIDTGKLLQAIDYLVVATSGRVRPRVIK